MADSHGNALGGMFILVFSPSFIHLSSTIHFILSMVRPGVSCAFWASTVGWVALTSSGLMSCSTPATTKFVAFQPRESQDK